MPRCLTAALVLLATAACTSINPVTPGRAGEAYGTEYLAYCSSAENNPSPMREEQINFFKGKEVYGFQHDDPSSHWLDYPIGYKGDQWAGISIRYFAGSDDERPCTFTLVTFANMSEVNEAQARYYSGNEMFPPSQAGNLLGCRSEKPPSITEENGNPVATIDCG